MTMSAGAMMARRSHAGRAGPTPTFRQWPASTHHLLPGLAALQVPAEEPVPVLHLEPRGTGAPAHRLLSEPQSGPATKPPKKTEMSAMIQVMIQVMPGQTRSAPRTGLRARMRSRQAGAAYA